MAADYNQALVTCRLAGTVPLQAAGTLLAICLIWAMTGWLGQDTKAEPLDTGSRQPSGGFLGMSWSSSCPPSSVMPVASLGSRNPPATLGNPVQTIQPKRDF